MGSKNKFLLLMTACIDVSNAGSDVHRAETSLRLKDYQDSLRNWLLYPDYRISSILFVENSGYSLESLKEIGRTSNPYNKKLEFLQYQGNFIPSGLHYGYAELALIDYAFENSILLRESEYLIKATGRLQFPGLSKLLDRLPPDFMFAVDSRNNDKFVKRPEVFVTTQLMLFSKSFYGSTLLNIKSELNSKQRLIENLLYNKLIVFNGTSGAILRWPIGVPPFGRAAHWDKNYQSLKQRVINAARELCRIVFPDWWV